METIPEDQFHGAMAAPRPRCGRDRRMVAVPGVSTSERESRLRRVPLSWWMKGERDHREREGFCGAEAVLCGCGCGAVAEG